MSYFFLGGGGYLKSPQSNLEQLNSSQVYNNCYSVKNYIFHLWKIIVKRNCHRHDPCITPMFLPNTSSLDDNIQPSCNVWYSWHTMHSHNINPFIIVCIQEISKPLLSCTSLSLLYIPYYTQVLNSAIQSFCIKQREYEIVNVEFSSQFHLVNICQKNESKI